MTDITLDDLADRDKTIAKLREQLASSELQRAEIFDACQAHAKEGSVLRALLLAKTDPPWLSDAAEALGQVRESDGAPLALNWTQVIEAIRELREHGAGSGVLRVERRHYALVAARARCWTMQQSLAKAERDGDLRPAMKSRYYELVDHLRQLEAATVKP